MPHFVWTREYELGIEVIDHQHQRIVDYINRLNDVLASDYSKEELHEILASVVDYTFSHLAFEEAMLEEIGYQDLRAHQLSHNVFSDLVHSLRRRAWKGEFVAAELASFLQGWLITHIMGEDAKYVESVKTSLLASEAGKYRHWWRNAVVKYFQ